MLWLDLLLVLTTCLPSLPTSAATYKGVEPSLSDMLGLFFSSINLQMVAESLLNAAWWRGPVQFKRQGAGEAIQEGVPETEKYFRLNKTDFG